MNGIWLPRQTVRLCNFWLFPLFKSMLWGTKQQLTFPYVFTYIYKLPIDSLMTEMQLLLSEKTRFVFQEKSINFHVSVLLVHKPGNAKMVSWKKINELGSADRKLLIETVIEKLDKVTSKGSESIYRDSSTDMQSLLISG